MKANRAILATALGLGLTSIGSAETLYVTGSTAFRTSFVASVIHLMGGSCQAKADNANIGNAGKSVMTGTIGGVTITVNCAWSGSVSGIQSLTNPADIEDKFLPSTGNLALVTQGGYPAAPTYTALTVTTDTATSGEADIAMSDVFQNSTIFTSPSLSDSTVAVIPFKMLIGDDANPANDLNNSNTLPVDNMTPLLTQLLYGGGKISQALFTGNAADNNKFVYALGRDNGSGTRLTVMAESGKGALNPVLQYIYSGDLGTFSLAGTDGNGGSGNGAGVATQLGYTSTANAWTLGYLGLSDADSAISKGAKELKWNGVPYSVANVRGGQYTLWGYEHLFVGPGASPDDQTVANAIIAELTVNPGPAGIALGTMNVQRGAEGGLIDLNN
jgi:hypothetical protein